MSGKALPPYSKAGLVGVGLMLITVTVVVIGYLSIQRTYLSAREVVYQHYPALNLLLDIDRDLHYAQLALAQALQSYDAAERARHLQTYTEKVRHSAQRFEMFEDLTDGLFISAESREGYLSKREDWIQIANQATEASGPEAFIRVGELLENFADMRTELDRLRQQLRPLLQDANHTLISKARASQGLLIATLVVALLLGGAVTTAGVGAIRNQHAAMLVKKRNKRERRAKRRELDRRLRSGLELVQSEADALCVVRDALDEVVRHEQHAAILLTDTATQRLAPIASVAGDDLKVGCSVIRAHDCPAIRKNLPMSFPSGAVLDGCPYLRNRTSCAAFCVPINIMGTTSGVLQTIGPRGALPTKEQRRALLAIAAEAGSEIGLKRAFATKEHEANTDTLTGLGNRRSLKAHVPVIRARGEYSVAFMDIDHFKALNDTHGHEVGDRALKAFAEVLRSSLRPDDLAARWGGEEFVAVFPNVVGASAVSILERVRGSLADRLAQDTLPAFTVSFGITDCEDGGECFETILRIADTALLRAKREGRNRIVYCRFGVDEPMPTDAAKARARGRQIARQHATESAS